MTLCLWALPWKVWLLQFWLAYVQKVQHSTIFDSGTRCFRNKNLIILVLSRKDNGYFLVAQVFY